MKNFKSIFIKTILFALFLVFMACSTETNKAYLVISSAKSEAKSSRNIAEAVENLTDISLKGTLNGTETNLADWENWEAAKKAKIEIEAGEWTFTLTAKIEETEYKSVVQAVIIPNTVNAVSFHLKKIETHEDLDNTELNISIDIDPDSPSIVQERFYMNNNLNDLYIKTSFPKEDSEFIYAAHSSFAELPDYESEEAYCYNNIWHFSLAEINTYCEAEKMQSLTITPKVKFEKYRKESEYSNWTNAEFLSDQEIGGEESLTYIIPENCYFMDTPYFYAKSTLEGIRVIAKPYDEYTQRCHIGLKTANNTIIDCSEYDYNKSNTALFKCVDQGAKYFIFIHYYGIPENDWGWRYNVQSTTQIYAKNGNGEINYSMDYPSYDDRTKSLTLSPISFESGKYIMRANLIVYLAENSTDDPTGHNGSDLFGRHSFNAESTSQEDLSYNLREELNAYCQGKEGLSSVKFCVDVELHYIEKENQDTSFDTFDWNEPHYVINPFEVYDPTKRRTIYTYTR